MLNTFGHFGTIRDTLRHSQSLLDTFEHFWRLSNTQLWILWDSLGHLRTLGEFWTQWDTFVTLKDLFSLWDTSDILAGLTRLTGLTMLTADRAV